MKRFVAVGSVFLAIATIYVVAVLVLPSGQSMRTRAAGAIGDEGLPLEDSVSNAEGFADVYAVYADVPSVDPSDQTACEEGDEAIRVNLGDDDASAYLCARSYDGSGQRVIHLGVASDECPDLEMAACVDEDEITIQADAYPISDEAASTDVASLLCVYHSTPEDCSGESAQHVETIAALGADEDCYDSEYRVQSHDEEGPPPAFTMCTTHMTAGTVAQSGGCSGPQNTHAAGRVVSDVASSDSTRGDRSRPPSLEQEAAYEACSACDWDNGERYCASTNACLVTDASEMYPCGEPPAADEGACSALLDPENDTRRSRTDSGSSGNWFSPKTVSHWTGKGVYSHNCEYTGGNGVTHSAAKTIDNDASTSWNAHPCRQATWELVYDLGSERPIDGVQMRSIGNGWHDPRNFTVASCTDDKGTSCGTPQSCSRTIETGANSDANKAYQACPLSSMSTRYVKVAMKGWGKSGSTFHESGVWQYGIVDVQFSGAPTAPPPAPCEVVQIPDVTDNGWYGVEWTAKRTGHFKVSLGGTSGRFGAWGKGGKLQMRGLVECPSYYHDSVDPAKCYRMGDPLWIDLEGHHQSGEAYEATTSVVSDTLATTEWIQGIQLRTPTWTGEGAGWIAVCPATASGEFIEKQKRHYVAGKWFSEEDWCNTASGCEYNGHTHYGNRSSNSTQYPMVSLECWKDGSYCDDKLAWFTAVYETVPGSDVVLSEISEEAGRNTATCPDDHAVVQLTCSGDFCDNLVVRCKRLKDVKTSARQSYKLPWITDNIEPREASCGDDVVTGIQCRGRFCDDLQLTCSTAGMNRTSRVHMEWADKYGCTKPIPPASLDWYHNHNLSWSQVSADIAAWASSTAKRHIAGCRSPSQSHYYEMGGMRGGIPGIQGKYNGSDDWFRLERGQSFTTPNRVTYARAVRTNGWSGSNKLTAAEKAELRRARLQIRKLSSDPKDPFSEPVIEASSAPTIVGVSKKDRDLMTMDFDFAGARLEPNTTYVVEFIAPMYEALFSTRSPYPQGRAYARFPTGEPWNFYKTDLSMGIWLSHDP